MSDPRKILVPVNQLEALIDQYDPTGEITASDPDLAWIDELRRDIERARKAR